MYKLISLIGLFAFVGYAGAFPLFDEITGQRFVKQHPKSNDTKCTSFAGTWKGTCKKDNAADEETTIVLQQDGCQYIGTKDMMVPIGGVADFGLTTPQTDKVASSVSHATAGFVWNADRSQLVIDVLAVQKELGTAKTLQSYDGQGLIALEGEKLDKLTVSWADRDKEPTQICSFTKQQ